MTLFPIDEMRMNILAKWSFQIPRSCTWYPPCSVGTHRFIQSVYFVSSGSLHTSPTAPLRCAVGGLDSTKRKLHRRKKNYFHQTFLYIHYTHLRGRKKFGFFFDSKMELTSKTGRIRLVQPIVNLNLTG